MFFLPLFKTKCSLLLSSVWERVTHDLATHAFYFGMRYAFGGETLQEIERDGASKDLPDLGRWFALGAL